ncbi:Nuclear transport factor 2 [Cladophialophora chaetospira]|uniref:Nuclear transport factor 2 n=1 Tax=Cladophialophora chaetospira TaxID=386627 RepID=A0AA38WXB6_9EURO|nr:Nuclear transport factor 2 [Cladophialophora chaetospira]
MGDFAAIAQQFVEFYYKTFDTDRNQLATLYDIERQVDAQFRISTICWYSTNPREAYGASRPWKHFEAQISAGGEGSVHLDLIKDWLSQNLPFQKVQHRIDTVDSQPFNEQGGILVMVTGALLVCGFIAAQGLTLWAFSERDLTACDSLQVDDQQHPMSYVQTFSLQPESGSYFVFNDVFRLVYAAS